jgi:hypothetical protein
MCNAAQDDWRPIAVDRHELAQHYADQGGSNATRPHSRMPQRSRQSCVWIKYKN